MDSLVKLEDVSKIYPRVHKSHERLQAFISLLFGREPAHGAKVLDNDWDDPGQQLDGAFTSAYLQATYNISESTSAYGRLERTDNEDAPYLQLFPLYVHQRELVGLRWDFARQQALHVEVSNNRTANTKYSEYRIQWSAVFP